MPAWEVRKPHGPKRTLFAQWRVISCFLRLPALHPPGPGFPLLVMRWSSIHSGESSGLQPVRPSSLQTLAA